nr:hypothetical protein [uncultured Ruminococcus sp.]
MDLILETVLGQNEQIRIAGDVYPDFQLDILFDVVSAEKYRLLIQTDTWRQIDQPV